MILQRIYNFKYQKFVYSNKSAPSIYQYPLNDRSGRGRPFHNCMVVGFTTTCAISAYHHYSFEFEPCSLLFNYVIKFVSYLLQVGGFLPVPRFPPQIKLTSTIYNWNIVDSDVNTIQLNLTLKSGWYDNVGDKVYVSSMPVPSLWNHKKHLEIVKLKSAWYLSNKYSRDPGILTSSSG
jgi:hypothetical protein